MNKKCLRNSKRNNIMTLQKRVSDARQRYERNISEMLKRTRGKARAYGGDPFYEYREKKLLPERFEYGMDCFFDRIAEDHGEEFVQKVYKEFR